MSSEELKPCLKSALRAMASNYANLHSHCWDHLDSETCNKAADELDALEAENARLREDIAELKSESFEGLYNAVIDERDAARAQLAAIQQAKGEEVEVVGYAGRYQLELRHLYPQYPGMKIKKEPNERYTDALMTVAQHQRITAAMAAEVERLRTALRKANEQTEHFERNWYLVSDERDALRAELEKPEVVFINMKCGIIAKPSLRSIVELYAGEVLNGEDALQAEILRLRAELAAVKGQEAVAVVDNGDADIGHLPHGTKLYTTPPASPDVEGLVKELEQAMPT